MGSSEQIIIALSLVIYLIGGGYSLFSKHYWLLMIFVAFFWLVNLYSHQISNFMILVWNKIKKGDDNAE